MNQSMRQCEWNGINCDLVCDTEDDLDRLDLPLMLQPTSTSEDCVSQPTLLIGQTRRGGLFLVQW
jgi:hypothetical protein